jgi:hypothetical protein
MTQRMHALASEVASRTEQDWYPIKHAARIADPHQRYDEFLESGDAAGYRARLDDFRARLRAIGRAGGVTAARHAMASRVG